MEDLELQRHALVEMRVMVKRFMAGEMDAGAFLPPFRKLFAPFDPDIAPLRESERTELDVYSKIAGGWFGEDDELIPRRKGWVYGRDLGPYDWIDVAAYREWIRQLTSELAVAL